MVVGVDDRATTWWPSPFGPEDELGMLNHITDRTRAAALELVRSGRLYDLGRVLDQDVPAFPGRYFRQTLVTTAHHANRGGLGANRVNWIIEQVAGTQQLGTHVDALSHLQIGDRGYNGWSVSELAGTAGRNGNIKLAKTYHNTEPHKRLLTKLKDLVGQLGCHHRSIPRWSVLGEQIPLAGIAHNCGTVRFGTDPGSSALDVNCKAHDVDNLYVVDTSFFPSSSAINPSLTAIANALRIGDHVIARLGARSAANSLIET